MTGLGSHPLEKSESGPLVFGVAEKSKVSLIRGFKLIRKFRKFITIKIYLASLGISGLKVWLHLEKQHLLKANISIEGENKLTLRKTFYCVCGPTPTKVE